MELPERLVDAGSRRLVRHDDLSGWGKRERALVEQAVVQRAERERVRDDIRRARAVPLDVGSLQADGFLIETNGEA